jgi:hypothetical protein
LFTAWRCTTVHAQSNADRMPRLVLARTPLLLEEPPPREPHLEDHWYGWQTLIVDAASVGFVIAGAVADSEALFWVGMGGYVFGGPIVHFAHARVGIGFADMGVRTAAVLVLWLVALLVVLDAFEDDSNDDSLAVLGMFSIGALIGAAALDAAVFARERVWVGGRALLRPWYDARSGSAGLRVAGAF